MTKSMIVDIIILFLPAFVFVFSSTKLDLSILSILFASLVFSTLPKIVSNEFNDTFATIYGTGVGMLSLLISRVTQ